MIKPYSEKTFCIDLIIDFYTNRDPYFIIQKVKEDLEIQVTLGEVLDYLSIQEDFEKESRTVQMNEIFKQ